MPLKIFIDRNTRLAARGALPAWRIYVPAPARRLA